MNSAASGAPRALGLVHRGVGIADQRLGRCIVGQGHDLVVGDRNADTHREVQVELSESEATGERLAHPFGQFDGGCGVGNVCTHHEEFVAADAGDLILGAHAVGQPSGR